MFPRLRASVFAAALLLAVASVHVHPVGAQTQPQIDIGVWMSVTGSFNLFDAFDGVVTWARYVNEARGGIKVNGVLYKVNLITRDDQSNITLARVYWQEFATMGLKYVIGGHTSMTVAASEFFEPLGIVNIHCCTGPDDVYMTNPKKWILGIHRSSLDYPKSLLRLLSLRAKKNIAIVYSTVSAFTITTADSAESFASQVGLNVLAKLEYNGAGYKNLTTAPGGPQMTAAIDKIQALVRNGTKLSLFGICLGPDGNDFARYVDSLKLDVETLFITVAPTSDVFMPAVGPSASEYVYSPLQWHNSMAFTDPLFNSSVDYQRIFKQYYNYTATYTAASGSAAGLALHLGILSAGTIANSALVMQALRELRQDTFFGPLAFNRYQRNYGGATATIQVLDGRLQAVLPDVSAQAQAVFPPSMSERARCPTFKTNTAIQGCLDRLNAEAAAQGNDDTDNTVIIAVVVPIAVVVALVMAGLVYRTVTASNQTRNVGYAPKSGKITLMFTDVQDSTKLWSTVPMCMSIALDLHHALIRESINAHKCYEVKTAGDSFMIACDSEQRALELALDIQRRLHKAKYPAAIDSVYAAKTDDELLAIEDSPDAPSVLGNDTWNGLRVRIGFHSGTPQVLFDEVSKGYDYYGPPVNTAARVESVAKGARWLARRTRSQRSSRTTAIS
jgi:class 3 adenylate cyclase/ABC-type branched-subunit amino acid transport system substrate-binding protein